jgi:arabinofuranosyltransferase
MESQLDIPPSEVRPSPDRSEGLPVAIAVCLCLVVVLRCAWICDDAYITFRTVDNFVSGYGPRWNVAERVQAFTHPLWMLLLSGVYAVTRELHYTAMLTCVVLTFATVVLFVRRIAVGTLAALLAVVIFTLSKAFVDYSAAGLENPLTHLLLVLFCAAYLTGRAEGRSLLLLTLLAGLVALNRLDALLLVLPALCVAFWQRRSLRAVGAIVLGFAPFLAWETFALIYYGSLLPNTAYAKLHSGLPAVALFQQGLFYLLATLKMDPLTLVAIVAGLAVPLITGQRRHLPLALGVVAYVLYVVAIGGDFMVGRFLTAPLLVAVVLIAQAQYSARTALLVLFLTALIGLAPGNSPLKSTEYYRGRTQRLIDEHGICDERAYYYSQTGLLLATRGVTIPTYPQTNSGRLREARQQGVVIAERIGMFGFFAGRDVHVVDRAALADPLLARLAPDIAHGWRIGHLWRSVPEGYLETLKSGENRLEDAQLAERYDRIALVTRGALWSRQRWRAIVRLNLGF